MPARRTLLIILAALPFLLTTTGLSTAQTPPSDELWIESESDCDTEGSHCVITGAFIGSTVCRPGGLDDCVIQWGCSVTATLSAPNSDGERFAPLATRTARVVGGVDGCYIKQRVGPGTPWATAPVLDELKGSAVSGGVLRRITTKDGSPDLDVGHLAIPSYGSRSVTGPHASITSAITAAAEWKP